MKWWNHADSRNAGKTSSGQDSLRSGFAAFGPPAEAKEVCLPAGRRGPAGCRPRKYGPAKAQVGSQRCGAVAIAALVHRRPILGGGNGIVPDAAVGRRAMNLGGLGRTGNWPLSPCAGTRVFVRGTLIGEEPRNPAGRKSRRVDHDDIAGLLGDAVPQTPPGIHRLGTCPHVGRGGVAGGGRRIPGSLK